MATYRKKPVNVEAYQWFKDTKSDDVILMDKPKKIGDLVFVGMIKTLEDTNESCHYVCDGDFIVHGNHNDIWAVKENIFLDAYELIEDTKPRKVTKRGRKN